MLALSAVEISCLCASLLHHLVSAVLQNKVHVDVGFWAGLVPQNANDSATLTALMEAGALGFKAFLSPAGDQLWKLEATPAALQSSSVPGIQADIRPCLQSAACKKPPSVATFHGLHLILATLLCLACTPLAANHTDAIALLTSWHS